MTFEEYQKKSRKTAIYPGKDNNFVYPTLGLVGEAGEVAEKIKKVLRDDGNKLNKERLSDIEDEMGDVLWYMAQLATELNLNLSKIAQKNLKKLKSRKMRGKLHGDGDHR